MTPQESLTTYLEEAKVRLIQLHNEGTMEKYAELLQAIRESDAWTQHLVYSIMKYSDTNKVIPANDLNRAFNNYVDSKTKFIASFTLDESGVMNLDYLIRDLVHRDHNHIATLSVPIKPLTV